jgi:hypothetical protein
MAKSIPHEQATIKSFKRDPELLLEYINACIQDAIEEEDTSHLLKILYYLKACGFSDLFSLMDQLHYFN